MPNPISSSSISFSNVWKIPNTNPSVRMATRASAAERLAAGSLEESFAWESALHEKNI
jgi:hypothetical protein